MKTKILKMGNQTLVQRVKRWGGELTQVLSIGDMHKNMGNSDNKRVAGEAVSSTECLKTQVPFQIQPTLNPASIKKVSSLWKAVAFELQLLEKGVFVGSSLHTEK